MTGSSPSSIMRSMVRTLTPPSCAAVSRILHSRVSGMIEQVSAGHAATARDAPVLDAHRGIPAVMAPLA